MPPKNHTRKIIPCLLQVVARNRPRRLPTKPRPVPGPGTQRAARDGERGRGAWPGPPRRGHLAALGQRAVRQPVLRHHAVVLQRQLGHGEPARKPKPQRTPTARWALLAAAPHVRGYYALGSMTIFDVCCICRSPQWAQRGWEQLWVPHQQAAVGI